VLRACDYFGAECHRDVAQARFLGFQGKVVGVWPVAGGIPRDSRRLHRAPGPSSRRKAITVKGQGGLFGRGDVAREALDLCGPRLRGYELCVHSAPAASHESWRRLAASLGATVTCATEIGGAGSRFGSHEQVLAMHGRSRASISLGISAALCTSGLEAAAMGSLPIRSTAGCSPELLSPETGALYVSAEDPEEVAAAVVRALDDPELVDRVAAANDRMAESYLDPRVIRARVIDGYERMLADRIGFAEAA
jgi:glycosyltransferase involved in cell wall biosynthesis